ncbi:MAG: thermonuclease family protein [Halobacteriales archaeon]
MDRLPARLVAAVLLVVLAGCISVAGPVATETVGGDGQQATVTAVIDGDTLDVQFPDGTTDTVRLLGVDSPETQVENEPQEFEGVPDSEAGVTCLKNAGQNASVFVRDRAAGATVSLRFDPLADRRDRYDRLLAYVELDGVDLNRLLVDRGHARVYDSQFTRSDSYYELEATAQSEQRGLWRCRSPSGTG